MRAAQAYAINSFATRRQVGALLCKNNNPIADGWNGTPPGKDNACEEEDGKTKSDVVHAEVNAYLKLLRSHESSEDTTLYVTCCPCEDCANFIVSYTGTTTIFFKDFYRSVDGLKVLLDAGLIVYLVGNGFDEEPEDIYRIYSTSDDQSFKITWCHDGESEDKPSDGAIIFEDGQGTIYLP
jgi:dCMP deaminase